MGAARKYPDELRDRAVRLVLDLVKDQDASVTAACRKVGGEPGGECRSGLLVGSVG